jgi:uncharacterized CHY-type Zn-finger protein
MNEQDMWCFHCEHTWTVDDYFKTNECPNCDTKPIRIYRSSSTAIVYAYLEKYPLDELRQEIRQ